MNPGYISKVMGHEFYVDAGPMIYCPNCKKPIMEAVVDKVYTRCKHCDRWIYLERKKQLTNNSELVKCK